jgi:hypothetical protein
MKTKDDTRAKAAAKTKAKAKTKNARSPSASYSRRIKPTLERTAPVRGRAGAREGDAPGAAETGDPIAAGVDFGYRVIREYLAQGEQAARKLWTPAGTPSADPMGPGFLLERTIRHAEDLAWTFMDMLRGLARTAGSDAPVGGFAMGRSGAAGSSEGRGRAAAATRGGPAVEVDVRAPRPVAVTLDLEPGAASRSLLVPPLRGRTPGASLGDVSVASVEGGRRLVVTVPVPARQATGTYRGPILDADTRQPRGEVTVSIGR